MTPFLTSTGQPRIMVNNAPMNHRDFHAFCKATKRCFLCGQGHAPVDCPTGTFLFPRDGGGQTVPHATATYQLPREKICIRPCLLSTGRPGVMVDQVPMNFRQFDSFCRVTDRCVHCGQEHQVIDCPILALPSPLGGDVRVWTAQLP